MIGAVITLRPATGGEIHCLRFDRVTSTSASVLKGHATFHLPKLRLQLFGCGCFASDAGDWVLLPSRAWIDRDGNIRRDAAGKVVYLPMLAWDSRAIQSAFSKAAIAALDAYDPHWRGVAP